MDVTHIIDPLNDPQRDAVTAPQGQQLVLAGAGSGKTRVLVHRIAWIMAVEHVSPYNILAVTFTNKAAAEMKHRIEALLGQPVGGMWVGTFHSLAHRFLRAHWQDAGLPQAFQILDSDDQYRLIRRLLKTLELDEAKWPPRQVQWFINTRKDEGQRPAHVDHYGDPYSKQMLRIYQAYEDHCNKAGLVDFAELLLRAHELLRDRADILHHYRERFRFVLVDEFQDTNTIQYAWLRLLAGEGGNLFIVGDDDQSIYGWRGAKIENIHRFSQDYPGAQTIRLEQNYRSTATILKAANALIDHNADRLGKELWTDGEEGEPIQLYTAFNDLDEARFIVERIQHWIHDGHARREAAILYRSNAQSRVLEAELLHHGIPYRIYGGQRFFERQEIKDAMAYLRLIANRHDDGSFERVVNTPTRGIGERSISAVRDLARERVLSLWSAAETLVAEKRLAARANNAIQGFLNLIDAIADDSQAMELAEQTDHMLSRSGLIEHYQKEKGEKGQARVENLEELVSAAREFEYDEEGEEGMDMLTAFLAHAALEAGEGQGDPWEDCVQLMTLHSAKGLEFPLVFLCGMEEGLFPHQMSLEEPGRLEEERRLCYVGITRARLALYITHAEVRRLHGQEHYSLPSRFVTEIPDEFIHTVRPKARAHRATASGFDDDFDYNQDAPDGFHVGQRVFHQKFGQGVLLNYEGQGSSARVQVNFDDAGSKWLVIAYANLHPC
ncbi:DNA helicase II [Candidatus Tenderia electrophaga]|jgi:DNA helicase-2/ATP-dependent DNA helicase PcrA|uniref:DNA 3'-5' helicase n=1 Tax=Candidatus Tenderia electrophaga TaxID=1748243 RepID=A0A0S2TGW2_9GAMM|nr:DNA helicase II [Candidatus Tenderia electrophaga]